MTEPDCLKLSEEAYTLRSKAKNRENELPLTEELLLNSPSGDIFGLSQNAGMGWDPRLSGRDPVLLLTTLGGLRRDDGLPVALGYHTGHWELGLVAREAAEQLKDSGCLPFAAHVSDPCDGRTQGTTGMMDSLAYRNSAAETMGRLIRSLPRRKAVVGIASCDKGLPAVMMALAEAREKPGALIPGGVTLPPETGEDAGTVQSIGARFAHGELSLKEAAELGCAACASPGGGCQFLGTAASSQILGEALGIALPHSSLAPSGEPVWLELGRRTALAVKSMMDRGITLGDILTDGAINNAMAIHAAFGASTNMLLHLPAIAHSAGLKRPTSEDWTRFNKRIQRIVDVLPNGPRNFRTVQVYLAGGVPEVMLHLRHAGVLNLECMTVSGMTVGENLEWWENSERRERFREMLKQQDGVEPEEVIMSPERAAKAGLSRTVVFPRGNICPEGSVVKSTSISPDLYRDGVYRHRGPARVFTSEEAAIRAVKSNDADALKPNEVVVLACRGPLGAGMPETAQITISLKYTKRLKTNALITDGRFSGFSSGPCIGHVGPEALADGPIGKLMDGDIVEIVIDNNALTGQLNLLGTAETAEDDLSPETGEKLLRERHPRPDLAPDPELPESVRLWAALQQQGGGTWGGCVYDTDAILKALSQ